MLRPFIVLALLGSAIALGAPPAENFSTPEVQSREAAALVSLLEDYHYNRDAVHSSDYAQVIPAYMEMLGDSHHLFFLASDKAEFMRKYGGNIYYNARLGNIDAAYDIFYRFRTRVEARIHWIFAQLKGNFDFTADDTYRVDRSKSPWPADQAEADELWRQQLTFELITEMLGEKPVVAPGPPGAARQPIPSAPGAAKPPASASSASSATGAAPPASATGATPPTSAASTAQAAAPAPTPLDQAKDAVRHRYEAMLKNLEQIDEGDLAEDYLTCIAALYDPHSSYFSADDFDNFGITMKLELVGIGALLEQQDDYCTVVQIIPGGPADLGHQLKAKDRILSVAQDGQAPVDIIGMKLPKVVDMIRGPQGTRVRLVVHPGTAVDPSARKEIVITRDKVKLNLDRAHGGIFQVPGPDGKPVPLGVISLPEFYGSGDDDSGSQPSASLDIKQLIVQMQAAGMKGLVLDLRENGGGLLSEAINLVGLFVGPGPVVQVKESDGRISVDDDDDSRPFYTGPLAVLVDRDSASASEIVAGALQNYGRAIVVGDKTTHGKGTVQTVIEMKNLPEMMAYSYARTGAAKITIQKFYLPNGSSTQLDGVASDIAMPSIEDYLPIGESDMPHALIWDRVAPTPFNGAPLAVNFLSVLRQRSQERQSRLEEFSYLNRGVDWFRDRDEQKLVSLNLDQRRKEEAGDDAFRKSLDAERDQLAKNDWPWRDFRLGPVPPPLPAEDGDDEEDAFDVHDPERFTKVDVLLRETLRILDDAIQVGQNRQYWVSDHPPMQEPANG